jgi:hypothetical protein
MTKSVHTDTPGAIRRTLAAVAVGILVVVLGGLLLLWVAPWTDSRSTLPSSTAAHGEATKEEVHQFCAACHAYPPPDSFPRANWYEEVKQGYDLFHASGRKDLQPPPMDAVVRYYEKRAPEALVVVDRPLPPPVPCCRFERVGYRNPEQPPTPAVTHVRAVQLTSATKLDLIACEAQRGLVLLLRPYEPEPKFTVLTDQIPAPCHVEVTDLDGDGIRDLLVANLGVLPACDAKEGSVVWLRGQADGGFTPITLIQGLGRVADVRAADFDGDGDLDLIVAVFGWREVGELLYLENQTTAYAQPRFVARSIDPRHGAIHVPVADLNGDGRPDFVALFSQEHETVEVFLNLGGGRFERRTIYSAPHPACGSSGIELVDLDGDKDLDVLYTAGDSLDKKLLRPDHGVHWLENRGTYPFTDHLLTPMYGVHRAIAADFDQDGDLDIVAAGFLAEPFYQQVRSERALDALILLEQTEPGRFVRHVLESVTSDHLSCDVGDFDGDGRPDIVTSNFSWLGSNRFGPDAKVSAPASSEWISIWRNRGTPAARTRRESPLQAEPGRVITRARH